MASPNSLVTRASSQQDEALTDLAWVKPFGVVYLEFT